MMLGAAPATIGLSPTIIKKENIIKKSPLNKHVIANLFDDDSPTPPLNEPHSYER